MVFGSCWFSRKWKGKRKRVRGKSDKDEGRREVHCLFEGTLKDYIRTGVGVSVYGYEIPIQAARRDLLG